MLPAGILRELVVIERARQERNEVGEAVQTRWDEVARRRAAIEQSAGSEAQQMYQTAGSTSWLVRMRFCEQLATGMRLRWVSRANRILYVASVVERGNREEHEVLGEERR
jgi:head-tail adaptor